MNYNTYARNLRNFIGAMVVLIAYRFKDCYYDYGFYYICQYYCIDRTVNRTGKLIIGPALNRLITKQEHHLLGVICSHRRLIIEICKRFVLFIVNYLV
jgi:hypothetical protein